MSTVPAVVVEESQCESLPLTASGSVSTTPSGKIVVGRYKTKMCRNYIKFGSCPYEHRCMFAHGEEELRSEQQNESEGILSEEDLRRKQRAACPRGIHATKSPRVMHNAYSQYPCTCPECAPMAYPAPCMCHECVARMSQCNCPECDAIMARRMQHRPCMCPECVPQNTAQYWAHAPYSAWAREPAQYTAGSLVMP